MSLLAVFGEAASPGKSATPSAFDRPSAGDNPGEPQPPPSGYPIPPAPVLSPAEALQSFQLQPGFRIELVASEPLIAAPVAIDFDPDGRIWVVEMRGYQNNPEGTNRLDPTGRIVVLDDTDGDGKMDRSTVYMDKLVLPRAIKVLSDGVLVAEPPYVWHTRDTDGDGRADTKSVVVDDYSPREGNPSRAPSGLMWGLDNWIHSSTYSSRLRCVDGKWVKSPVPVLGDWGMGMDDFGRMYHNGTSGPLRANLISSHYQLRNPHHVGSAGIYEVITAPEEREVWPSRPTPGVNRGYMKGVLHGDGRLVRYTACCGISIFRGDCLPPEFRGNHFIAEPAAHLIRRSVLTEEPDGRITARNAYHQAEFLTSSDERFRPVNTGTAPDGTLYIVDMYRGILESHPFVTTYLKRQIHERGLGTPIDRGRIYRVRHDSIRPGPRPQLSRADAKELVQSLAHANGWWRDTAQRLLVERGDRSIVGDLRAMARNHRWEVARFHALWTLDGLGALTRDSIVDALKDEHAKVRSAAVRLAEPQEGRPRDEGLLAKVRMAINDPDPGVRLQAAVTLAEFGPAADRAVADLLLRHAAQPFIIDAVISGLAGRELEFLLGLGDTIAWQNSTTAYEQCARALAAAVFAGGSREHIERLLEWTSAPARPNWQQRAVLTSLTKPLPHGFTVAVPAALVAAEDPEIQRAARQLARHLEAATDRSRPLTAQEKSLRRSGARGYTIYCAQCHQENGRGLVDTAAPLAGSKWVLGPDEILARIVLHGKQRQGAIMPPWGNVLDDQTVASILSYIRHAWGNNASPVQPATVRRVRSESKSIDAPWTDESLTALTVNTP